MLPTSTPSNILVSDPLTLFILRSWSSTKLNAVTQESITWTFCSLWILLISYALQGHMSGAASPQKSTAIHCWAICKAGSSVCFLNHLATGTPWDWAEGWGWYGRGTAGTTFTGEACRGNSLVHLPTLSLLLMKSTW